jgi:predicted  nucleic acid-binding Zn-ribbon protein
LRADLAGVQERFAATGGRIEKAEGQLSEATRQVRLLTLERDQLKDSITNWMNAVTQRDERIKEGNTQIRKLADDLTASVNKFNSLATNYNATVQQLNEVVTNRNEMITRYNTLVEEVNKAREQEAKK